jgi:glycyl-tRNA synthetase
LFHRDAEILMSSGWVECVGIADRSAYDLTVHSKATKTDLFAKEFFTEVREEEVVTVSQAGGAVGKTFKQEASVVLEALKGLEESKEKAMAFNAELQSAGSASITGSNGKSYTITKDMVKIAVEVKRVSERKFVPSVIEPSFGIGRIITGVLEHNFSTREGDEQRAVLSFAPVIAPYKAVVLPQDPRISKDTVRVISAALTREGLSNIVDDSSASLGKRYSRCDEVGIPFGITVDFDTAKDNCVTIRERDTCAQIRVPIADVTSLLKGICEGESNWSSAVARYPVVTTGEDKAASAGAGATAAPTASAGAGSAAAVVAHVKSASASAAPSSASSAPVASGKGSVGVVVEGQSRGFGKFFRPADL